MADSCSTCMYMRINPDQTMHCRRYAPNAPGQGNQPYLWPEVTSDKWCGEGRSATTGAAFAQPMMQDIQPRMPVTGKKA